MFLILMFIEKIKSYICLYPKSFSLTPIQSIRFFNLNLNSFSGIVNSHQKFTNFSFNMLLKKRTVNFSLLRLFNPQID